MTASDWVLRGLGLLVGAVFACVSFTANSRYAVSQGHDVVDGYVYLAATLGTDALKVLMPLFGVMLWSKGHKALAFAAWSISTACLTMSVIMALGWSSSSTGSVNAEREKYKQKYAAAQADVKAAQLHVDRLPSYRPAATMRSLIDANTVPAKTWRTSAQCTNATTEQSRQDCIPVLALRAELAAAESAPAVILELTNAKRKLAGMAAPIEQVDPPAATLSKFSRGAVAPKTVRSLINGGWTLIIELCSTLTFTVAMLATGAVSPLHVRASPQRATVRDRVELPARTPQPLSVTPKPPTRKAAPPPYSPPRGSPELGDIEPLRAWAKARLVAGAYGRVGASEAHRDYLSWSRGKKLPAYTPQHFGVGAKIVIAEVGGQYVKARDGRYFTGVALGATAP